MIRVFFLLFALFGVAHAETIPASSQTYESSLQPWRNNVGLTQFTGATPSVACESFRPTYLGSDSSLVGVTRVTDLQYTCNFLFRGSPHNSTYVVTQRFCSAGDVLDNVSGLCTKALGCPSGQSWTLSGSSCTRPDCQLGYDRNASGVCVKDCTGKAGQPTPSPSYQFPNGGFPSVGGCMVRCATNRQSGGGTSLVPLTLVGDSCTYTGTSAEGDMSTEGVGFKPEPKAPKTPADCIGSGMGYIQGSTGTTCVASSDAPAGQKPETSHKGGEESGKTGPDGKPDPNAPDYNKKEKDTQNKDGKTTETTEETTKGVPDGSGGTTCPAGFTLVPGTTNCTKSTTTTKDTSDYCAENPKSPVCKGTEEADACIENPDRIGCVDMGAVPTTDPLREEERGVSIITPVQLAENHSCPQGVTLPKGIGSFDWQPMCDYASALKPVILAIAWLSAFFIVMGFSQSED